MAQQPDARHLHQKDFDCQAVEMIVDPFARLRVIMKRLLDPGGCPWDREQTHQSIKQYFIEEVYEACEALDLGDDDGIFLGAGAGFKVNEQVGLRAEFINKDASSVYQVGALFHF